MTARTKYQLGNTILIVAILLLIVNLLGMLEIIPKYVPSITLSTTVLLLVVVAGTLRRRGKAEMAAASTERTPGLS